jgi:hypothetical protein
VDDDVVVVVRVPTTTPAMTPHKTRQQHGKRTSKMAIIIHMANQSLPPLVASTFLLCFLLLEEYIIVYVWYQLFYFVGPWEKEFAKKSPFIPLVIGLIL